MTGFVRSIVVIFLLLGIVVGSTMYSDQIKKFIISELKTSSSQVLGANTKELNKYSVTKQVHKEAQTTLDHGKQQLMQVKIGDIVNSFSQAQKVVKDVNGLQQTIHQQLQNLAK